MHDLGIFFCSKIIFCQNYFLTAEINLTTWVLLYTFLVQVESEEILRMRLEACSKLCNFQVNSNQLFKKSCIARSGETKARGTCST